MNLQKRNHFVDTPDVIANPRFHRWRHAQSLVNPAKVGKFSHFSNCTTTES
jgi:hypothetical protein